MRAYGLFLCFPACVMIGLASGCAAPDATVTPYGSQDPSGNDGGTPPSGDDGGTSPTSEAGGGGPGPHPVADSGAGSGKHHDSGSGDDAGSEQDSGNPPPPPPQADCSDPTLVWKTGAKTNFTSYPDPGSAECIQFNGCAYEGQFAACSQTESQQWVQAHNIVSVFPDFNSLKLHDLCLKKGSSTIVVTVLDECANSDCSGCCTRNQGGADQLIDVESYTDARWGVGDGDIEWADLGPTAGSGCQ